MSREILIALDHRRPLRAQIEAALRDGVRSGRLRPGTSLPSTRTLAKDLSVSRGLVVEAYEQLVAEGYFAARQGSRTVVSEVTGAQRPAVVTPNPAPPAAYDFRPGAPDTTLLPQSRFLHHLRGAAASLGARGWGYGDPAGFAPLRRALCAYLGRVRGVQAGAEQIVICSGFAGAVSLLARLLRARGCEELGLEDPGSVDLHPIARLGGLAPLPIGVDGEGIDTTALARSEARAVIVTPAHQFPTGTVLSARRRADLVAWARAVGGLIVEDDYDAEYRYDRSPVGAVQGLDPERVIYAGTLSKTLAPALRLGWLVLPRELTADAIAIRRQMDLGSPTLTQAAFASMLESGDYDRHLRRARRLYRQRRDRTVRALEASPLALAVEGATAGLHVVARLPKGLSEADALAAAAQRDVRLYGLSQYRTNQGPSQPQALVLGYGAFTDRKLAAGLRQLRLALDELHARSRAPRSRGSRPM